MSEKNKFPFWCNNNHKIVHIKTTDKSPHCPVCGAIMTFGD